MRHDRVQGALREWADTLEKAMIGHRVRTPDVPRRAEIPVLRLWCRERDTVVGRAAGRLTTLAVDAGLDRVAVAAVRARRDDVRLTGIEAAGRLGLDAVWADLVALARRRRQPEWERACVALVRIAPERALRLLLPLAGTALPAHAPSWTRILAAAPPPAVATAVGDALHDLSPSTQACVVRAVAALPRVDGVVDAVRRLLRLTDDDPGLVAACAAALGAHGDGSDAVRLRPLVAHPAWSVRLDAAAALGRLGDRVAVEPLAALLDDEEWLVRRAAAEALAAVGNPDTVAGLAESHPDATVRAAVALALQDHFHADRVRPGGVRDVPGPARGR